MTDSVRFRLSRFFNIFFALGVAVAVVLLTVPAASAAPARLRSPMTEPVPEKIVNGDGTITYSVYLMRAAVGGTAEQDRTILFRSTFTVPESSINLLFLPNQQGGAINITSSTGSAVVESFNVDDGSLLDVYRRSSPSVEAYQLQTGYTTGFKFVNSYFPRSWGMYAGPSVFVHYWLPDGVQVYDALGSYSVADWVDWAVDPAENIFYSHLDRPVQDPYNRYIVGYNRQSKEGVLIHFNIALSGVFSGFNDFAGSLPVSGELDLSDLLANSQGYYDSTGQFYQTSFDQNGDTIDFTLSSGSISFSGNLNQWIDGSTWSPELDFSSGIESYKFYQPSILYNNYGAVNAHYNIICSVYNLLDGTLKNQYIFDSVLSNSNSIDLNIGTPLSDLGVTHILTFGTLYKPQVNNGLNWGSVVWSVDPVVVQWRSDVSLKLDSIIELLRNSGGEEPTTISRDLASGLAQAEEALQPKDADGNPINVADEAQRVFDDSLDQIDELKPGIQFIQDSTSFLFERPIVLLPVFVALTLGLLITIIGKNKSG